MKYIIWGMIIMCMIMLIAFIVAPLRFIWHLVWHAELISFHHATSCKVDGERYYFFHCKPRDYFRDVFIYRDISLYNNKSERVRLC